METQRQDGQVTDATPLPAVNESPTQAARSGAVTEIGPTIIIRGKLKSSEDLVVRGRIEAEVTSDKSLHIERSGIVRANVQVSSARIDGILVGNITATDKIEIAAEGRVVGDLLAPRIVIREGAAFRGNIDMPNFDADKRLAAAADGPAVPRTPPPVPQSGDDTKRKKRKN